MRHLAQEAYTEENPHNSSKNRWQCSIANDPELITFKERFRRGEAFPEYWGNESQFARDCIHARIGSTAPTLRDIITKQQEILDLLKTRLIAAAPEQKEIVETTISDFESQLESMNW